VFLQQWVHGLGVELACKLETKDELRHAGDPAGPRSVCRMVFPVDCSPGESIALASLAGQERSCPGGHVTGGLIDAERAGIEAWADAGPRPGGEQAGRLPSRAATTSSAQPRVQKWMGLISVWAARGASCTGIQELSKTVARPFSAIA
jgi:hypothetical protein